MKRLHAALLTSALLLPPGAHARLPSTPVLPSALAVAMAEAALHACEAQNFHVAVAIVDPAGGLRVLIAGDGVRALDVESARRKAVTASALGAPTAQAAAQAAAAPAYGALLLRLNPDLLLIGGGLPIMAGSDMVGAIGVGGAPGGDKDQACAAAAIAGSGASLH
jgi:uncharacterized protein GlcG (DUF336 family)